MTVENQSLAIHGPEAGTYVFSEVGNELCGTTCRTFHNGTLTDGMIIGWLPPEGPFMVETHELGVITLSANDAHQGVAAFTHQLMVEPLRTKIPRLLSRREMQQTLPPALRPRRMLTDMKLSLTSFEEVSEQPSVAAIDSASSTDASAADESITSVASVEGVPAATVAQWIGRRIRLFALDEPRDASVISLLSSNVDAGSDELLWRVRHDDGTMQVRWHVDAQTAHFTPPHNTCGLVDLSHPSCMAGPQRPRGT